mmetsp:Transcript_9408/g.40796  ORF Transcript_9408/g.40796 Transcript_9408/m.40796 type:complete len:83 (-) Transcript_9408:649-897(-)
MDTPAEITDMDSRNQLRIVDIASFSVSQRGQGVPIGSVDTYKWPRPSVRPDLRIETLESAFSPSPPTPAKDSLLCSGACFSV